MTGLIPKRVMISPLMVPKKAPIAAEAELGDEHNAGKRRRDTRDHVAQEPDPRRVDAASPDRRADPVDRPDGQGVSRRKVPLARRG